MKCGVYWPRSQVVTFLARESPEQQPAGYHEHFLQRDLKIARFTVCAIFKCEGISKVYKHRKVSGHTKLYSLDNPLECVQTDSAWSGFEDNHGNRVYFFPVIDDCSRSAIVHVCDSKSGDEAVVALEKFYGVRLAKTA